MILSHMPDGKQGPCLHVQIQIDTKAGMVSYRHGLDFSVEHTSGVGCTPCSLGTEGVRVAVSPGDVVPARGKRNAPHSTAGFEHTNESAYPSNAY